MPVNMHLMHTINDVDKEIRTEKARLKEWREDYKADIQSTDEYRALEAAKNDVKLAKAKLEHRVSTDSDLARDRAEIDAQAEKVRDLREILSHHLVEYFKETGKTAIRLDVLDQDQQQQVIVNAKLGRVEAKLDNMELPL